MSRNIPSFKCSFPRRKIYRRGKVYCPQKLEILRWRLIITMSRNVPSLKGSLSPKNLWTRESLQKLSVENNYNDYPTLKPFCKKGLRSKQLTNEREFVSIRKPEGGTHYKRGKLSVRCAAPRRVRRNKRKCKICATWSRKRASPQIRSPIKNFMNRCARLASISVVILIRTDTTLDHSQKAEKVCQTIWRRKFRHARVHRGKLSWILFSMGQSPPKNW